MIDTYDEHSPLNPINQKEVEEGILEEPLSYEDGLTVNYNRLQYKIKQLKRLAEIEASLNTFGTLTFELKKEKIEILNQYL